MTNYVEYDFVCIYVFTSIMRIIVCLCVFVFVCMFASTLVVCVSVWHIYVCEFVYSCGCLCA